MCPIFVSSLCRGVSVMSSSPRAMSHHIVLIGRIRSSNCLSSYYRAYLPLSCVFTRETKRIDDCDVATGVNYGVASTSNWSMSICDREMEHHEN